MGKRRTGKEADVVLSDGEDGEVHQVAQLWLHLADPAQITHSLNSLFPSVTDLWRFHTDPDPQLRTTGLRIRI
jgi:hypothetical protein